MKTNMRKKISCKENKEEVCIVRGAIMKVSLKGKTKNNKDVNETFTLRVTSIMDKHYNRWFVSYEKIK